ncbi:hypothetical protein Tco_1267728 [Tanacetum coccineum]
MEWISWKNVLTSKRNGGLGVSSFYALNRAFESFNSIAKRSTWLDIVREVSTLSTKGFLMEKYGDLNVGELAERMQQDKGSGKVDSLIETARRIVATVFGVSITSLLEFDALTRRIEAGDCEDTLDRLTNDERKAAMDTFTVWGANLLAHMSDLNLIILMEHMVSVPNTGNVVANAFNNDEQFANEDTGYVPSPDMPIVHSVSISRPVSYAGAVGASSPVTKNVKANLRPLESEIYVMVVAFLVVDYYVCNDWSKYGLTRVMMNSKGFFYFKFESRKGLEDVLENESWMIRDEISLIATQIGKLIMLDSFTSSRCIDSWGRSSFKRCLIEVRADETFKDSVSMGIPLPEIFGHVYDQCPNNVTIIPTVDKMNKDGFQAKVRYELKAHGNFLMNGAPKVSTSAKDDPSKKLHAKKGESEDEAEVVYDETVNLKSTRTGASPPYGS